MKIFVFALITCCFSICYSQKTEAVNIPGMKYRMIPPQGYYITDLFHGFYNSETGGSIMISEIPGSYPEIRDGMTAPKMKAQGMNLLSKEDVEFLGKDAVLLLVSQRASGTTYMKQIIITGDDRKTLMVNGIYLATDSVSHRTMKASLFTLTSDNDKLISPEDASAFSIDASSNGFIFKEAVAGGLSYEIKDDKETYFSAANSLVAADIDDHRTFVQKRVLAMPHSDDVEISALEPIVIAGMNGYEVTVNNKKLNRLTYTAVVFAESGFYYIMVGSSNHDHEKMLKLFRKTASTLRLKTGNGK